MAWGLSFRHRLDELVAYFLTGNFTLTEII